MKPRARIGPARFPVLILVVCAVGPLAVAADALEATEPEEDRLPGGAAAEAHQQAERLRTVRRAQATQIELFAPYYTVKGEVETRLFLMNTVTDPITVSISALGEHGAELPLGERVVEPLRHLELPMSEALRGFEEEFGAGSLRVRLLGDPDTVQAWAVIQGPGGETFEIPLRAPQEVPGASSYAFWSAASPALRGGGRPSLHLVNTAERPLAVSLAGGTRRRTQAATIQLKPTSRVTIHGVGDRRFPPNGWLRLDHDGEFGDLIALGLVESPETGVPVEVVSLEDEGGVETTGQHESMPFSFGATGSGERFRGGATIDLFNSAEEPRAVVVDLLDATSGSRLRQKSLVLEPKAVRSLPLHTWIRGRGSWDGALRVRVGSEGGSVLVQGSTVHVDGTQGDITFSALANAHGNGIYPLPDPARYESSTTLVNLGEEDSELVAQVYWEGGTYALGPLTIPAGGAHTIDLHELAETAPPDVLGRELDRQRPGGVLQWMIATGTRELIGRTEVRPRTGSDAFGFNCQTCCWENPVGLVVPGEVSFTPGQVVPFESCVHWETCSGTIGPFPIAPQSTTVPPPFAWDGQTVTAGTAADGELEFEALAEESFACMTFLKPIFGKGRAEMCQETFNPREYSTSKTCGQQTSFCLECRACCHNIFQMQVCQGKDGAQAGRNRDICLGICLNDHICNE